MKKTTLVIAAAFAAVGANSQTTTNLLTPQQIAELGNNLNALSPLLSPKLQGYLTALVTLIGVLGTVGRLLHGTVLGDIAQWLLPKFTHGVVFGTNTPQPANIAKGATYLNKSGMLLVLLLPALLLAGCTLDHPQGKILSVTTRGLYIAVSSTDSQTGTPAVKLGLGSQTVTIIPTDTNKVYAAAFANTSSANQTVNPFVTSGNEQLAAGVYSTQIGTNNFTKPTP